MTEDCLEVSVRVARRDVRRPRCNGHGRPRMQFESLRCPLLTQSGHLTDDIFLRKKYIMHCWSAAPRCRF
jgi:hypothetical protein